VHPLLLNRSNRLTLAEDSIFHDQDDDEEDNDCDFTNYLYKED
jgi:hypothetical protein